MSLKQLVLDMTPEARKELVELIASVEAKEAEPPVAVVAPGDAEAPVA